MSSSSPALRFGVVGNPIAHSRSPDIHRQFAQQAGLTLSYEKILAPLDDFAACCQRFFQAQGKGLNITVPFKEQAYELAKQHLSERALHAGAVNTLWMENGQIHGCNTDGVGLCADLHRLGHSPQDKRILLIGAGGAARGVLFPLLEQGCAHLHIINRTASKAHALRDALLTHKPEWRERLSAGGLQEHAGTWDLLINASSASMSAQAPALPDVRYSPHSLAYDMFYAPVDTAFMQACQAGGAAQTSDGLGMLVAQAAVSFEIWNQYQPDIGPVLDQLRADIKAQTQ